MCWATSRVERLGQLTQGDVDGQGVEDVRNVVTAELDIDDRPDHSNDATAGLSRFAGVGFVGLEQSGHYWSLPVAARASAPPTISLIS